MKIILYIKSFISKPTPLKDNKRWSTRADEAGTKITRPRKINKLYVST